MKQDKITALQYATLTFFLLNSFLMNVGYHMLTTISHNDAILDILLGGIMILLFGGIIFTIHRQNKGNIIEIIKNHFSPIFQILFFLLLFVVIGIASIYAIQVLTNFIHYYVLKEVDYLFIIITLVATVLYIVKKGLATISKMSEIFLYIYLLILMFGLFGLIQYIDLSNLKPLFTVNLTSHMKASSIYFLAAIIPLFLLLMIPKEKIEKYHQNKKYIFFFTLFSILLCFLQLIIIISILGIHLTNIYQNPDMIVYKKISFLNVLERVEVLLSFSNILNSLFFILLCVSFMKEVIYYFIKNKKEHIILALIGIILIILSNILSFGSQIYLMLNLFIGLFLLLLFFKSIVHKHNH